MTISHKKANGVYYTPQVLAKFAVRHLYGNYIDRNSRRINALEPSAGDGEFACSIINESKEKSKAHIKLDLIDIDGSELLHASERIKLACVNKDKIKVSIFNQDFLLFDSKIDYDLIIGNPPYIGKKHLSGEQIDKIIEIESSLNQNKREVKNIWPSFIIKSFQLLKPSGTICLVLPSELLQVNYSERIRKFITNSFKKIEIFTFKEIIFPGTQQDVILLIASNSDKVKEPGVSFYEVEKLIDLEVPDYTKKFSNIHRKKTSKWTNYILDDTELNFIEYCKEKVSAKNILSYSDSIEVGIVTAANNFFILNKDDLVNNKLSDYGSRIIQKGSYINGHLTISSDFINKLDENDIPSYVLLFEDKEKAALSLSAQKYLEKGEGQGLHLRYKMKQRNNWQHFKRGWVGDLLFVKRTHNYPKLVLNEEKILNTDSLYKIKVKSGFKDENILGSFYNTLTFIDCELKGRYYGGGVLELTPNEFKSIDVPYYNYRKDSVKQISEKINRGIDMEIILVENDNKVLKKLTAKERKRLRVIYSKVKSRRMR